MARVPGRVYGCIPTLETMASLKRGLAGFRAEGFFTVTGFRGVRVLGLGLSV